MPPATPDEAYRVQDRVATALGEGLAGWKVGIVPLPLRAAYGTDRLFGPIPAAGVRRQAGDATIFTPIPGGFAAVEAEIAFRIAHDVPPRTGWTDEAAAECVAEALIAVELAGSPVASILSDGPLAIIADRGINAGLVLGRPIAGWQAALPGCTIRMFLDGNEVATAMPIALPGGPLRSLAALLEHLGARGLPLAADQLVATGAVTGSHPVRPGTMARADFGELGTIAVAVGTCAA